MSVTTTTTPPTTAPAMAPGVAQRRPTKETQAQRHEDALHGRPRRPPLGRSRAARVHDLDRAVKELDVAQQSAAGPQLLHHHGGRQSVPARRGDPQHERTELAHGRVAGEVPFRLRPPPSPLLIVAGAARGEGFNGPAVLGQQQRRHRGGGVVGDDGAVGGATGRRPRADMVPNTSASSMLLTVASLSSAAAAAAAARRSLDSAKSESASALHTNWSTSVARTAAAGPVTGTHPAGRNGGRTTASASTRVSTRPRADPW